MGRLIRSSEFDGANNLIQRIEQLYDKANRLEKQSWVIDGDSYSESYTYNDPIVGADASVRPKDGSLASVTTATGDTVNYGYDALKRLTRETVKDGENTRFYTAYAYRDIVYETQTTGQVEYRNVRREDGSLISGFKYAYDAVGNITDIYESQLVGNNTERRILAHYEYDTLNQLTQEKIYNYTGTSTTPTSTDTYDYAYDSAGNMLTEKKNGTIVNTYTYSTGAWADQLVEVNGEEITYDGAGNPDVYVSGYGVIYACGFDGRNWLGFQTWSGLQMQVEYAYDADGIRTSKTIDWDVHNYVTQNGKVVRETIQTAGSTTSTVLDFIYDTSGRPFALIYKNGTDTANTYYYVLNLQGDVVALTDATGAVVAQYTYNAWGKILSATGEMAEINPIRYRGYYYDTETGFYYLQSRYYDPANHRFINADSLASTGQGFVGNNMYIYCGNNPVRRIDITGNWWLEDAWDWATDKLEDAWDWTTGVAEDAWDWTCNAAETVADTAVAVYDYVTNTDEQVVLDAKFLAFYKGVPVIKLPIGTNAFSFGFIFLGDEVDKREDPIATVQHEYGHSIQFLLLGPVKYTTTVAIPSVIGFLNETDDYYSQPWEYMADQLGGVKSRSYTSGARENANIYWFMSLMG